MCVLVEVRSNRDIFLFTQSIVNAQLVMKCCYCVTSSEIFVSGKIHRLVLLASWSCVKVNTG